MDLQQLEKMVVQLAEVLTVDLEAQVIHLPLVLLKDNQVEMQIILFLTLEVVAVVEQLLLDHQDVFLEQVVQEQQVQSMAHPLQEAVEVVAQVVMEVQQAFIMVVQVVQEEAEMVQIIPQLLQVQEVKLPVVLIPVVVEEQINQVLEVKMVVQELLLLDININS